MFSVLLDIEIICGRIIRSIKWYFWKKAEANSRECSYYSIVRMIEPKTFHLQTSWKLKAFLYV